MFKIISKYIFFKPRGKVQTKGRKTEEERKVSLPLTPPISLFKLVHK